MSLETDVALIARAAHGQPPGICVCWQCREAVAAHVHAARAAGCAAELGAVLCSGRLLVQHVPLSTGCVVRRLPADVPRMLQSALPRSMLCCGVQCQVATTEAAPRTVLRCVPAQPPEHEEQTEFSMHIIGRRASSKPPQLRGATPCTMLASQHSCVNTDQRIHHAASTPTSALVRSKMGCCAAAAARLRRRLAASRPKSAGVRRRLAAAARAARPPQNSESLSESSARSGHQSLEGLQVLVHRQRRTQRRRPPT